MSKRTLTKFHRTHKGMPIKDKEGNVIKTLWIPRENTEDAIPLNRKNCWGCGRPMWVPDGSIQKYHKDCRKQARQKKIV